MRSSVLLLVCLILSIASSADNDAPKQHDFSKTHNTCTWCHTSSNGALETGVSKVGQHRSTSICLSCHDGIVAQTFDDGHFNHAARNHNSLDCITCHDPHDRTHSYMALKGKRGPETEGSAKLDFCRGCHADH
jgi:hypothetical protein